MLLFTPFGYLYLIIFELDDPIILFIAFCISSVLLYAPRVTATGLKSSGLNITPPPPPDGVRIEVLGGNSGGLKTFPFGKIIPGVTGVEYPGK